MKVKEKKSWWIGPISILAHAYGVPGKGVTDRELEDLVLWKRGQGFEAEHWLSNGTMMDGNEGGDDPTSYLFNNRKGGCNHDLLLRYLPFAKKHGLKVIVYFNVHWFKTGFFPDAFFSQDRPGHFRIIYGSGRAVCPNGPFRDWAVSMAEDLGAYPVDGVFLDGPLLAYCACPHCTVRYRERHNESLPDPAQDRSPERLKRLRRFQIEEAAEFINRFSAALHQKNPGAVVYNNNPVMGTEDTIMRLTRGSTGIVGAEGGFEGYQPLDMIYPFKCGVAAKLLESRSRGRGRVIFSDGGFKVYDHYPHPEIEVRRMYAATVSNAANPWFLMLRNREGVPGHRAAAAYNRFITRNREFLHGESMARTALLHGTQTFEFINAVNYEIPNEDVGHSQEGSKSVAGMRHAQEFQGAYAALTRSGHPFSVIEESELLEGRLPSRIRLIILAGVSVMSDAVAVALTAFVRRGGRLLATFDTGLYDETGRRRPVSALAEAFGIGAQAETVKGPCPLDYCHIASEAARAGLSQDILPAPEYSIGFTPVESTEALLFDYLPMPRRYASLPPVSDRPVAIAHRFGKGRAVYFNGAFLDHYRKWHFSDERVLFVNLVNGLSAPPVTLEGGGEFVEAVLRRAGKGLMLHLINWASGERPAHHTVPIGPLAVRVDLPRGFKPKRIEGLLETGRLKFKVSEGAVRFTLRKLKAWEAVLIN